MQKIKIVGSSTAVLALTLMATSGGVVFAHSTGTTHQHTQSTSTASLNFEEEGKPIPAHIKPPQNINGKFVPSESKPTDTDNSGARASLQHEGAAKADQLRKKQGQTQTQQERQKKCESRKQGLVKKFNRIVANSQRTQTRIDTILAKAQSYKQAKKLTIANYDTLVATAEIAKAASVDSITNLKAVTPSLDCNNSSVANDIATFKAAAETTRDSLKNYRKAVKAVLQALQTAKQTDSEGTGGDQ